MSALEEVSNILQQEHSDLIESNRKTRMISIVIVLFVGAYLTWANSQLSILLNPEGMADAATGIAVDSIPEVSASLKTSLVEGAPAIANQASDAVVGLVPLYRQQLEGEIKPINDEVSVVLSDSAVRSILASGSNAEAAKSEALNAGVDAVVTELDRVLEEAMDVPDDNGRTPRQAIEAATGQLKRIDKELKNIAKGSGDARERELLLTWMSILNQYEDQVIQAELE